MNFDRGRSKHKLEVLLAEDSPADVRLFQMATAEVSIRLTVARDGKEAMELLQASEAPPDLIVLDLHLPLLDGFQILEHVKSEEALRSIPVIVLSTSSMEEDVLRAYRMGAASYVAKPGNLQDYLRVVRFMVEYWGHYVKLPRMAGC